MTIHICHKFRHLVCFILTIFLLGLKITTANLVGYQDEGGASNYKCIDKERHALLDFKAYIDQDPVGFLSTWTVDEEATKDCCSWSGVTCNNHSHVTSLDLRGGDLKGKISSSLLNLTYLNDLFLSHNSFHGSIPKSIGSLTELRQLDLSFNFLLNGTIPPELGNLTNLQVLKLESLSSCTIENLDWLSHLSQLEEIYLNSISLGKADNLVNMILNLQKLFVLSLDDCDLSQIIHPYSYSAANFSFPPHISQIYLQNNNLNSSMYHWLFPLTSNNLEVLDLSGNKLDRIPEYLGNLCNLQELYFDRNSMPIVFPDLLKNLSRCPSVTLRLLQAQSSQLTGSISDDIQKFSSLSVLLLSDNKLNGSISEKLWKLPNLDDLDLSFNYLKGAITKIKGKSKITIIDLSNNSLEVVPSIAWKCSVRRIDMSSNNFYGPIPHVPSTVMWLDLSKNKFYGRISFLCENINGSLGLLDLSDNSLTGEIPDCFWHFKQLRVLKLGQNNFSGRPPASMKYLTKLEVLYLYNNSFTGEFPLSLQACKKLAFLDLGANKFSGYVPIWIGEKLQSLYIVRLSSNNFFGTIPSQLCPLVNLTVLDFSMNNLYGTIPTCLNNLTSMVQSTDQNVHAYSTYWEYFDDIYVDHMTFNWQGSIREFSSTLGLMKSIDLSSNNLTGFIPDELTDLHELITLNLSMNALLGEIPANIGQMKNLLHLDVSRNNLSGHIPLSMSQMTSLNYLDVSYNNLSGRIPFGTQLQSFERSRYIGNEGLCGPPLTNCPGDKELEVTPFLGQSEVGGKGIDELERWFYIGSAIGFATGFWIACGTLIVNRRWRNACFLYFDSLKDWAYVKVMVFIAKLQRGANA